MKLVSYTFTKEEMIAQIREATKDICRGMGENIASGDKELQDSSLHFLRCIANLSNPPGDPRDMNYKNNQIAEYWCDFCSDPFFAANPDVSDVLMLVEEFEGEGKKWYNKFWCCNNNEIHA